MQATHEVQADDVVVALSSVKLDGESARVASLVWVLAADGDSGESDESWRFLADSRQEVGFL
jgi:hypothetical protein